MEGMNLQHNLGRFSDNYHPEKSMGGYLALGKITKVHHKMGTVDVMIVKTNDALTSDPQNEGRFGARVGTSSAHFDKTLMSTSGSIEPLQEGQLVILAFLDGLKNQPVILCSMYNTMDVKYNILTNLYPLVPDESIEDLRESLKSLKVHPTQFYTRIDGVAGMEVVHPSKSFLKVEGIDDITDDHLGTDHANLLEKDPNTFETRSGRTEEASFPVSLLYVHRSSFDDIDTTWTKFLLTKEGLFRITRDNRDGKLTYQEVSELGQYKLRRQLDSTSREQGQNFSEMVLGSDGAYKITRKNGDKEVVLTLTDESIQLHVSGNGLTTLTLTGNNAFLESNGTIILKAPESTVQGNLTVDGNMTTTGTTIAMGRVTAQGGATVRGGLNVSGGLNVTGDIAIEGGLTATEDMFVNGKKVLLEEGEESSG